MQFSSPLSRLSLIYILRFAKFTEQKLNMRTPSRIRIGGGFSPMHG